MHRRTTQISHTDAIQLQLQTIVGLLLLPPVVLRHLLLAHRGSLELLNQLHALGRTQDLVRRQLGAGGTPGRDDEAASAGLVRKSTGSLASGWASVDRVRCSRTMRRVRVIDRGTYSPSRL